MTPEERATECLRDLSKQDSAEEILNEACGMAARLASDGMKLRAVPQNDLPQLAETLPDCMMPDGADPCIGYQQTYAALSALEKERDNWKKATEVAIASEKANRAKLEAERDKLKEEVERLKEMMRFADQDCAAECSGLRGEVGRLTEACDGYLGHAAGLRADNAKLKEEVERHKIENASLARAHARKWR
jgi:chromosome segregation ATPase